MFGLSKKEKKPRIAYREQRNGVRTYYVETWQCWDNCRFRTASKETRSLKEAQKMLKEITDEEIIKHGIIK